jgi:Tol biopolymer transport system component
MGARCKPFIGFVILAMFGLTRTGPEAAPKFSEWGAPVLVPNVNSEFTEVGPGISKDGRSLYFASDRPGGFGSVDLWVSQRDTTTETWGPPVNLGPTINTPAAELVPAFSRDGHWMFFNSDRPGGYGSLDVWSSYRPNTHDDLGWTTPVNLGANINRAGLDAGASYLASGSDDDDGGGALLFFGSDRPGGQGLVDLYVSKKDSNGGFGPPALLPELSSPSNDQRPSIRHDGLEIFFYSSRPGGVGANDLWVATRETLGQVWNTPENLGPLVNSVSNEFHPSLSSDGQTLYFASIRSGGPGMGDLYVTTRTNRHER